MTDISYDESIPKEVRVIAEPLIEKWKRLIPTWCHDCIIDYVSDGGDIQVRDNATGTCGTSFKYRVAYVTLYPKFLDQDDAGREKTIIHEFLHISLDGLYEFGYKVMTKHLNEDDIMVQEYESRLEAVVVDLTRSLYSKS